jgi:hypothetical protein
MRTVHEVEVETASETENKPDKVQQFKQILKEAPEIYGISPTPQQIEEFKTSEIAWRIKLNAI